MLNLAGLLHYLLFKDPVLRLHYVKSLVLPTDLAQLPGFIFDGLRKHLLDFLVAFDLLTAALLQDPLFLHHLTGQLQMILLLLVPLLHDGVLLDLEV